MHLPRMAYRALLPLVAGSLLPIMSLSPVAATWLNYQSSPVESASVNGISADYNLQQVSFGVNDTDQSKFYFYLTYLNPIKGDQFSAAAHATSGVNIDVNGDGASDYAIQTDPSTPLIGNYIKSAVFVDRTSGIEMFSSKCEVQSFTDLTKSVNWIGFSIKKDCIPFGNTIGVQAFTSVSTDGSASNLRTKLVPNSKMWGVTSPVAVSATTGSQTPFVAMAVPTAPAQNSVAIPSPANPPDDLVALASAESQGVVTIKCGTNQGSGWSARVNLTALMQAQHDKSYVITNAHVVVDCVASRQVEIVLPDQSSVEGTLVITDDVNDLAGIVTTAAIPALDWQGSAPQQGWWEGIIGSPLGFPGVLTEGIVSSISIPTATGTTTAHINPGNSGGPAFDRKGRVVGIATAKYAAAEAFGIFHGTPMMCSKVVQCAAPLKVWDTNLTPTKIASSTPASLLSNNNPSTSLQTDTQNLSYAGEQLLNGAKSILDQSYSTLLDALNKYPSATLELAKLKTVAPKMPTLTGVITTDISVISQFSTQAANFQQMVKAKIDVVALSSKLLVKKFTITCKKGADIKAVTGAAPKCPAGFTLKATKVAATKL